MYNRRLPDKCLTWYGGSECMKKPDFWNNSSGSVYRRIIEAWKELPDSQKTRLGRLLHDF